MFYLYQWGTKSIIYRIIHWVWSTFKTVKGHLNGTLLTGNSTWGFSIYFANMGQEDGAKFLNFDPCTACGKTLPVSGGVYLPAFGATPLIIALPAFGATPPIVFPILCCSMAFIAPGCAPQIPHPPNHTTLDIQIAVSSAVIDSL